jgi:hypothetical protein
MRKTLITAAITLIGFASSVLAQPPPVGLVPEKLVSINENAASLYGYAYKNADYSGSLFYVSIYDQYNEDGSYAATSVAVTQYRDSDYRFLNCTIVDPNALTVRNTSAAFGPMNLDMNSQNCSTGGEKLVCHYEDPEDPWCSYEDWFFWDQVLVGAAVTNPYLYEVAISQSNGESYGSHRTTHCETMNGTGESAITVLGNFATTGGTAYMISKCDIKLHDK